MVLSMLVPQVDQLSRVGSMEAGLKLVKEVMATSSSESKLALSQIVEGYQPHIISILKVIT